jgi:hypothetical protein
MSSAISDLCPDCYRNLAKGERHTAVCLAAIRADAGDGDAEALAFLAEVIATMLARSSPKDHSTLQAIVDRGGYCAAFDYAHHDRRFA